MPGCARGRELLKSEIAIETKLSLVTIARAFYRLAHLGLVKRDQIRKWHVTGRGKTRRFETVPNRPRRSGAMLGPAAKRLLSLMRSDRVALGASRHHLVHHANQSIKRATKRLPEGGLSKHRDRPYSGGRQKFWGKVKNRSHPAMEREL